MARVTETPGRYLQRTLKFNLYTKLNNPIRWDPELLGRALSIALQKLKHAAAHTAEEPAITHNQRVSGNKE